MRLWRIQNYYTLLVRMQISIATMKNGMEVLQKIKVEQAYEIVTPLLLGIHPKKIKLAYQRDTYTFMFTKALFTVLKYGIDCVQQWMN